MSNSIAQLFVLLQRVLPKYVLTKFVHWLARIHNARIKDFLIGRFVSAYKVDIDDVLNHVPDGFATFNDFFIRELVAGAREINVDPGAIVSPVDGTVSAAGRIEKNMIFQAKGLGYSLEDLLATDIDEAIRYCDGDFATIYLAPYNYHRVHAPLDGEITAMRYVPGDLYSVNDATVRHMPNLFSRNERLVCHLRTNQGPMVLIFVGAMNVGTIHTRWTGDIKPRKRGVVEILDIHQRDSAVTIAKGDTIGWFNMGSTVILLLPPGTGDGFNAINNGQSVRMGELIGRITGER